MTLRLATPGDIPAIQALIDASVRGLQAGDYDQAQIDASIGLIFGVDRKLIEDGTYFVVERDGVLAGSGGWSFRRTMFGGDAIAGKDDGLVEPGVDAARIRAFFVSPSHARQGIGSLILEACERAAAAAGFTTCELIGTLTGERLYARRGYVAVEPMVTEVAPGLPFAMVLMRKPL